MKPTKPVLTLTEMSRNFFKNGSPSDCSKADWFELGGILCSNGIPTEEELKNKVIELKQEKIKRIYKGESK